jgi:putative FmdB family regulatory protein
MVTVSGTAGDANGHRGWHSYTSTAMPIYEYRCEQGHTFEVMRRMSDEPLVECVTCAAPVEQVFHPITVHFKGSGFYNTDYGTRKRAREKSESASSESKGDSGSSKSESKSEAKSSESSTAKASSSSSD